MTRGGIVLGWACATGLQGILFSLSHGQLESVSSIFNGGQLQHGKDLYLDIRTKTLSIVQAIDELGLCACLFQVSGEGDKFQTEGIALHVCNVACVDGHPVLEVVYT